MAVVLEVEAEDDWGVGSVELVFSVNGGEDQTIGIQRTSRGGSSQVSGGHTSNLQCDI